MAPDGPRDAPDPAVFSASTSELDVVDSGRQPPASARGVAMPHVRLGRIEPGGVSPAIMAIVERGVRRRPSLAAGLHAEIQLVFEDRFPPVRVVFADRTVLVEDGPAAAPDLRVEGTLADLTSLMVTPLVGGLPNPINARGRSALGMVAFRRVRITGRLGLMRRLIRLIRV
jgi:hypothetical protein